MKRVVVLGSTGSIGTQTLDIVSRHPEAIQVVGLAAGRNVGALREQAAKFGVAKIATFDPVAEDVPSGIQALIDLATSEDVDMVVVAVAGVIGLLPTIAAIEAGKTIGLASKEVLVAAGEIVMPLARKHGVDIVPIDSEHSAIFQCLRGYAPDQISRLIVTASGGPFRGRTRESLRDITVEQALNHPTWRMGGKITIDSATLMNKGLETIEARWLFDVEIDRIDVVVHPQSVVHSMVELADGSVLGQLGWPDMRLPIFVALMHPDRVRSGLKRWDPVETPNLTFEPVDEETFVCLRLARQAAQSAGTLPCVLNAANEEAANAFLRGEVGFLQIPEIVERTMEAHPVQTSTLESILAIDESARRFARTLMLGA
ncbi:1-deoxy-D-xylulose-5-phosphate reductoisomerase [bacterium]|nr:MAG: 1-deoxy-D-xylulose-5-phosphate reductoisomerase [bacterium]